jgi:hypothetical protein
MLAASHFTDLIGNTLPDIIYVSQDLKFVSPIFLDEQVTLKKIIFLGARKSRGNGHDS